jgi:hypothetical protein
MLYHVARVADHARDQNLAVRKLHIFPNLSFVFVARKLSTKRSAAPLRFSH